MQTCYLSNLGCPSQSRHPKIASWPAIFDDRSRAPQDGGIAKEWVLNRPLNRRLTDAYLAEVISSIPNVSNTTLEFSTIFMDFRRFLLIFIYFGVWVLKLLRAQPAAPIMIFMDFGAWMPEDGKALAVAPRESFTRFQLAAIIDFH